MIRGRLVGQEPRVPVTLHGRRATRIEAVLDTGFDGDLCLARRVRRAMRLRRVGRQAFELADGGRVFLDVYLGEITFGRRRRRVLVTLTDAHDSLVGTGLLHGARLTIDFRRATVRVQ